MSKPDFLKKLAEHLEDHHDTEGMILLNSAMQGVNAELENSASHSRQLWLDSQVSAATEVLLRERRLHNADCGCQAAPEGRCDWDVVITRLEGEFARIKEPPND